MTVRRRRAALALVAVSGLGLWTNATVAAAPRTAQPPGPVELAADDTTFYDVPSPMPAGQHGDLLRFQAIDDPFARRYRIMYLSETVAGEPTVVTGLVQLADEVPPFGGWRLLLHAHDAVGVAAACAPTRALPPFDADTAAADDAESTGTAVVDGWVVVSTDYERLGPAIGLPYLVGVSAGRSLLDAGRAARQLPVAYVGATTALLGKGQGGHAAMWAAQLAPEWTPEQTVTGTVAIAPTSEVAALVSRSTASTQSPWVAPATVAGLAGAEPEVAATLPLVLTAEGTALVRSWSQDGQCFDADAAPPPYVTGDPSAVEPFASLLRANDAGTVATPSPLLLFHGDGDQTVPLSDGASVLTRLCGAGQVVEQRIVAGATHDSVLSSGRSEGLAWLLALADGSAAATSGCPA